MQTMLVLEDDLSNLHVFSFLLSSAGFKVLETMDGNEAIEIAKRNVEIIDLLMADIGVPNRSGTEVALELLAVHPTMAVLFVTGTPLDGWDERDLNNFRRLPPSRASVLLKPFRPVTLLERISKLLSVTLSTMPLRASNG